VDNAFRLITLLCAKKVRNATKNTCCTDRNINSYLWGWRLFLGFGADIPLFTKAVIVSYPYWLAALVIPIGIYIKYLTQQDLSKKVKNRILFIFVSMLLFSIVLLPLIVTAMYLPIFELGSTNG